MKWWANSGFGPWWNNLKEQHRFLRSLALSSLFTWVLEQLHSCNECPNLQVWISFSKTNHPVISSNHPIKPSIDSKISTIFSWVSLKIDDTVAISATFIGQNDDKRINFGMTTPHRPSAPTQSVFPGGKKGPWALAQVWEITKISGLFSCGKSEGNQGAFLPSKFRVSSWSSQRISRKIPSLGHLKVEMGSSRK